MNATTDALRDGVYTVHSARTGQHRTFKVRTQPPDARFAPGERVVALLSGPDNESDYQPFGFAQPDGSVRVWSKRRGAPGHPSAFEVYAEMLDPARRAEWESKGYRYLLEARCRVCGRRLTTPESIDAGIGPECAGRSN